MTMDTTQLLKGLLEPAILAVLEQEDAYGYEVVRRLKTKGLDAVGDASVYGTLRRLFDAGHLTSYVRPSDEGPNRRYYSVNKSGTKQLRAARKQWSEFSTTLDRVLNGEGSRS